MNKQEMFDNGVELLKKFVAVNSIVQPNIHVLTPESRFWHVKSCAFYRRHFVFADLPENCIAIKIQQCAAIGTGGRCWSYPGHIVDRTPYGVLQHELGHHVEEMWATSQSKQSGKSFIRPASFVRGNTKEEQLTGYCANDGEWFAEMFRLLVTNPDLLSIIKPKTYSFLRSQLNLKIAETRAWFDVLKDAPKRTFDLIVKRIEKHEKEN